MVKTHPELEPRKHVGWITEDEESQFEEKAAPLPSGPSDLRPPSRVLSASDVHHAHRKRELGKVETICQAAEVDDVVLFK